jgi:hypothetical protein
MTSSSPTDGDPADRVLSVNAEALFRCRDRCLS